MKQQYYGHIVGSFSIDILCYFLSVFSKTKPVLQLTDDAADADNGIQCDDSGLVPVIVERRFIPVFFCIVV